MIRCVSMKRRLPEIERRNHQIDARLCCIVVLGLGLGSWNAPAAVSREVCLAISHGWAVVREERTVDFPTDGTELLLDQIPAEADLSSLIIRMRRSIVPVAECARLPSSENALPNHDPALVPGGKETVRWLKDAGEAHMYPTALAPVRCLFAEPFPAGESVIELIYRVKGFDWSCSYQIRIRGEQADEKEPISVDVLGLAKIVNPCHRSFDRATVWLIGTNAEEGGNDRRKQPGFLSLDESNPLADLWRDRPPEPPVEYEYTVQEKACIPAAGAVHVILVDTKRNPAEQVYFMDSEEYPFSRAGKDAPLKKIIVFKNPARQGLGIPLPAGHAQVFAGGRRTHLQQDAWIPSTPVGDEIRIDLGVAQNIRGLRQNVDRTPVVSGYYEETFRIIIKNGSDRMIRAEIDEKPPVNMEWAVVRASRSYKLESHRILFSPDVESGDDLQLDYRLRIRRPELRSGI